MRTMSMRRWSVAWGEGSNGVAGAGVSSLLLGIEREIQGVRATRLDLGLQGCLGVVLGGDRVRLRLRGLAGQGIRRRGRGLDGRDGDLIRAGNRAPILLDLVGAGSDHPGRPPR